MTLQQLHKILKGKKDKSEISKTLPIKEGCLSKGSVIIYIWQQKDTEIVAKQLNGAGICGALSITMVEWTQVAGVERRAK